MDRHALAIVYCSILQAMALATNKPVAELSGYFMRSMAEDAPPETQELWVPGRLCGNLTGDYCVTVFSFRGACGAPHILEKPLQCPTCRTEVCGVGLRRKLQSVAM